MLNTQPSTVAQAPPSSEHLDGGCDHHEQEGALYPSASVPAIEPDAGLQEHDLDRIRFGRNRFMRRLGGALFGGAIASVVFSSKALAACPTNPPPMCGPSKRCCCCNSSGCCVGGCTRRYGCAGGPCNCGWYTCYNGYRYFCGDWWQGCGGTCNPCICQILIGCYACSC